MDALIAVARIFASFLLGAVSFAKVAMIGTGIDITQVGSKNPGFNNVRRVVGWPRAAIPLVGDVAKGFIALFLFSRSNDSPTVLWLMGLAAVVGHCWSPLLGWNGGKGVATTFGVLMYLEWAITLPCLSLYPLLRWVGRRMGWAQEGAISSMTTTLVIATLIFILRGWETGVFAFAMFFIVVIRHIPNLREILA